MTFWERQTDRQRQADREKCRDGKFPPCSVIYKNGIKFVIALNFTIFLPLSLLNTPAHPSLWEQISPDLKLLVKNQQKHYWSFPNDDFSASNWAVLGGLVFLNYHCGQLSRPTTLSSIICAKLRKLRVGVLGTLEAGIQRPKMKDGLGELKQYINEMNYKS